MKKRALIIFIILIILIGGILSWRYFRLDILIPSRWWPLRLKTESPEGKIQKVLESGVFLREIELIPGISPESYLAIYIEDPKFDEAPVKEEGLFLSCPESTEGQAIDGIYHLILFQNNSVVNDLAIPSVSFVFVGSEQSDDPLRQKLAFKNTKSNIYWMFGGPESSREEAFDLQTVDLIKLKDFNGDGQEFEFKLTGPTSPCGHTQYLIAGYDKKNNQAVIYSIIGSGQTFHWHDNFTPDASGLVEWFLRCGDHGNDIEEHEVYQFDPQENAYILQKKEQNPCSY